MLLLQHDDDKSNSGKNRETCPSFNADTHQQISSFFCAFVAPLKRESLTISFILFFFLSITFLMPPTVKRTKSISESPEPEVGGCILNIKGNAPKLDAIIVLSCEEEGQKGHQLSSARRTIRRGRWSARHGWLKWHFDWNQWWRERRRGRSDGRWR